jgi:putative NIF3 family GTP cyclohydrolase 1 type 2
MDRFSMPDSDPLHLIKRRAFIASTLQVAGAVSGLAMPPNWLSSGLRPKEYRVQDVIDLILQEIPGAPWKDSVDTLKCGSSTSRVSGIVTTMFPTISVIEQSAQRKANFIIAHEPSFYNHADDTQWVEHNDVLQRKLALLRQDNMTIWRFHDYWHHHAPDGILFGVLKAAGWLPKQGDASNVIQIPPQSLQELVDHLKSALGIQHVRVIGDLTQTCKRIALLPGAADGQVQVSLAETQKPDVLIVGEVREWETAEYFRDAGLLGYKTALVVLGHGVSEEPGMQWLAQWLQPKLPGLVVTHIPSGDPFTWI